MESFYGGRPGYGFILRGDKVSGGYKSFTSLDEIKTAAKNNELMFGDYAIIGGNNPQKRYYGYLYRINENQEPMFISQITAPALEVGVNTGETEGRGNIEITDVEDSDGNIIGLPTFKAEQVEITTDPDEVSRAIELSITIPEMHLGLKNIQPYNILTFDTPGAGGTTDYYKYNIALSQPDGTNMPYKYEMNFQHPPIVSLRTSSTTKDEITFIVEEV